MSGYGSRVPPTPFKVPNCLNATWIHRTQQTKCSLQMATAAKERQSISLRVAIYCLLEFLINFICSFHMIVISYHRIEVDVMCSVQDINVSRFKKSDKNGTHQGQKKVVLFSEICWEQIFFHLPADIYTYLIPKNNEQTNKNKN